jgi:fibronectin type 3 domain-containing protein
METLFGLASFTDQWLTNGETYYYAVVARNAAYVDSAASAEVSGAPDASYPRPATPTGVVATPSAGRVTVTCNPVAGATEYHVYRSPDPGQMTSYAALSGKLQTWTTSCAIPITHIPPGQTYYFVVTAWNPDGESEPSIEVSGAIPP